MDNDMKKNYGAAALIYVFIGLVILGIIGIFFTDNYYLAMILPALLLLGLFFLGYLVFLSYGEKNKKEGSENNNSGVAGFILYIIVVIVIIRFIYAFSEHSWLE